MQPDPNTSAHSGAESTTTKIVNFAKDHRLPLLVVGHAIVFALVFLAAFLIRLDVDYPINVTQVWKKFWAGLPLVVGIKICVYYLLRNFHGWWRYVTFSDFISLIRASTASLLLIIAVDYFVLPYQLPRSVLIFDWVLSVVALGALRSFWRVWDERIAPLDPSRKSRNAALMIGDGMDAAKLAHLINSQQGLGFRIVGLVAPRQIKKKRRYSDLRVVGSLEDLKTIAATYRAKTVFLTNGTIPARDLRALMDTAADAGVDVRIVPGLEQQLQGNDQMPIREVQFEDLLRREPARLDLELIVQLIRGKRVLVTGAGGSIGSELCRQLAKFQPEELILLGRGENRIFHIERELKKQVPGLRITPRIASVTDERRMEELFSTYRPQVVFHAAAHKHVPLSEQNVGEAVSK